MPNRCRECDESWDRNPAELVACPDCEAGEGQSCKRPSGWDCAPHAARWQRAVDELCPLEECLAVEGAGAPDADGGQAELVRWSA